MTITNIRVVFFEMITNVYTEQFLDDPWKPFLTSESMHIIMIVKNMSGLWWEPSPFSTSPPNGIEVEMKDGAPC